jgi:hypothetical protein
VLTIRSAAALLNSCTSVREAARIADALGFSDPVLLDSAAANAVGAGPPLTGARVAMGTGSLRALIFEYPRGMTARELVTRLSSSVSRRAAHVSWLLIGVEIDGAAVVIGAPHATPRSIRTAALIVDRHRVLDSDADTLRALAAARSGDDLTTHARFVEVLGRDAVSRRFFRTLRDCVAGVAESARAGRAETRQEIALLYASRLLFLAFLESKAWLNSDQAFVAHAFDDCMMHGGQFHSRVLLPLFFGTLNTPMSKRAAAARRFGRVPFLNGGLFTPTILEKTHRGLRFSDAAFGCLVGELLAKYRFTAREETSTFEEAAIDPEMLGRTFESLMAADSRHSSGAFYTPHEIVTRVSTHGLLEALAARVERSTAKRLLDGEQVERPDLLPALGRVRVLDPACGSGAFLVHMLDRLTDIHRLAGDSRRVEQIRRTVLARSIFGVDVNPTAVWLCQLRLWLSVVIDTPNETSASVPPLPNLDRNIRVGDALSGDDFTAASGSSGTTLRGVRERYARSSGRKKAALARVLDREERRVAISSAELTLARLTEARKDLVAVRRGRDLFGERRISTLHERRDAADLKRKSAELRAYLRSLKRGGPLPFSFAAHFADAAVDGGFSVVVGNPPWVRPHRVEGEVRERLRRSFRVARSASWASGAAAAGASPGFASQVDLAALFVERSLRLLNPGGALSLLIPAKLFRSLSAGGLRSLLCQESNVSRLEDYSDIPTSFDAAVYPGLIVAAKSLEAPGKDVDVTVLHRSRVLTTWRVESVRVAYDDTPGSPWLLLPEHVRTAFDRLRSAGTPLGQTRFGRPVLGVKCGFNEAFLVRRDGDAEGLARIHAENGRQGAIESELLRPALRGEEIRRWRVAEPAESIVWTHAAAGDALSQLPPCAARWLAPHRRTLAGRADAKRAARWWTLFRTEAAAASTCRVVWADIGKELRAAVIPAGDPVVPLNTCYVVRTSNEADALALTAILNSDIATAWLSVIAEPARGGYRRFMGWTLALLPIPSEWSSVRSSLEDFARRGAYGERISTSALNEAVAGAYGLRRRDLDALLAWTAP